MASLNALPTEILPDIIFNIPERPYKTELLLLNKTFCSLFMAEQVRNLELHDRRLLSWITVITSNDMETPCSELRYCNFLSKVAKIKLSTDVNGNNLSEETIVGFITRCSNLRVLFLRGFPTTYTSLILNHLPSNIVEMHFNACSFGNEDEDIRSLVSYAKRNPKLEALGFSLVTINEPIWAELLEPNSTIKQFRLNSCSIGNKGAHALAEALKQNTTLTSLRLFYNSFYEEGAGNALSKGLKQNTTITDLKLHANYIDPLM